MGSGLGFRTWCFGLDAKVEDFFGCGFSGVVLRG